MIHRFKKLWEELGANSNPLIEYFKLERMYAEPHRFYHNLTHIENLLEELDITGHVIKDKKLIEVGIWFHDAVYDTKSKDNEEKSAELAYSTCLTASLGKDYANNAKKLVLATKHDAIPEDISAKIMVDIDLSILGKEKKVFDEYERNIRKEYSFVPEDKFREGRKNILINFLQRDYIYSTDYFKNKYEKTARINLQSSINSLN